MFKPLMTPCPFIHGAQQRFGTLPVPELCRYDLCIEKISQPSGAPWTAACSSPRHLKSCRAKDSEGEMRARRCARAFSAPMMSKWTCAFPMTSQRIARRKWLPGPQEAPAQTDLSQLSILYGYHTPQSRSPFHRIELGCQDLPRLRHHS